MLGSTPQRSLQHSPPDAADAAEERAGRAAWLASDALAVQVSELGDQAAARFTHRSTNPVTAEEADFMAAMVRRGLRPMTRDELIAEMNSRPPQPYQDGPDRGVAWWIDEELGGANDIG